MKIDEAKAVVQADLPDRAVVYSDLAHALVAGRALVSEVERLQEALQQAVKLSLKINEAETALYNHCLEAAAAEGDNDG